MLTATQTKYAKERVEAIYRRRREKLDEAYNDSRKLTTDEQIDALERGQFRVRPPRHSSESWYNRIEFPEKPDLITYAQNEALKEDLKVERDKIVDELVLGDATEALAAIQRFERGETDEAQ